MTTNKQAINKQTSKQTNMQTNKRDKTLRCCFFWGGGGGSTYDVTIMCPIQMNDLEEIARIEELSFISWYNKLTN